MNLIEFTGHFPDEESYEQYTKKYREKRGIQCTKLPRDNPSLLVCQRQVFRMQQLPEALFPEIGNGNGKQ